MYIDTLRMMKSAISINLIKSNTGENTLNNMINIGKLRM